MSRVEVATVGFTLALGLFLGSSGLVPGDPDSRGSATNRSQSLTQSAPVMTCQGTDDSSVGHPSFLSPHSRPIVTNQDHVFLVNTPADTVDVIDIRRRELVKRIPVGVDPVSIAIRPDGNEVWVSNHVSDSVSVIDVDPKSRTCFSVVATIQEWDRQTGATRFDEPVGIAFANNRKAYVSLSSENRIAVIDVDRRTVQGSLSINAQDPRAIVVRDDRLYVIPFESNNRSQLSGGTGELDGDLVTFDAFQHSVANNNVLSLGAVVDLIKHPDVPDHDLYVFDTRTDELVEVVDSLGTLLYGLTVDSRGQVFIAQTDARNDANGRAGTEKQGLKELGNRAFLNQITKVGFHEQRSETEFFELEPLPPVHPRPEDALATPFAIQISPDDRTLFVSAAGSDQLFTVDAITGEVKGRVGVDAVPRGVALISNESEQTSEVWVLNAVANTVSVVEVGDSQNLEVVETIVLEDPTHPKFKRGRIAFNSAAASTTGTFSCASCHPDGHTDQLLWVLKTPVVTGGDQIMPRSTMPIRGLRDTAPFHWDGIPGDPYGGNNSANVHGSDAPNSDLHDPTSSTRHLIDGALSTTMNRVGNLKVNDEGKVGALTASQRDDMATFLLGVPYPPAQRRAFTNVLSKQAQQGFKLFHIDGDLQGDPTPNVCGDCHRMPYWVSTNTPGTGMDAPTWRGAYDRWLILPQGRLNLIGFDFYERVAKQGIPEQRVWQFSWAGRQRFDPVWDMVLEGSTGVSGAFARQVTLNPTSVESEMTRRLVDALEQASGEGAVVLQGEGVFLGSEPGQPVELEFREGRYVVRADTNQIYTRDELWTMAETGQLVLTLTARHGFKADVDHPQPALWTLGPIHEQRGLQQFPILYSGNSKMALSGRHFGEDAYIVVDGRREPGTLSIDGETVVVELNQIPEVGMHFLQVQVPQGLFSNDFIFHVTQNKNSADALRSRIAREHTDPLEAIAELISQGDLEQIRRWVDSGARINQRRENGSTLLSTAAVFGNVDVGRYLIEQGARVSRSNADGNSALHVAAFFGQIEFVELLLENDAPTDRDNNRGETPVEIVSSPWSDGLAGFYRSIGEALGLELDLTQIRADRPRIAKRLLEAADDSR